MNLKKILTSSFALLCTMTLFINQIETNVSAEDIVFDFSKENTEGNVVFSAEELIKLITNTNVSDVESEYLASEKQALIYDDKIPGSNVTASLSFNELTIKAQQYSYVDKNNHVITWTPISVNYENNEYPFSFIDGSYECFIGSVVNGSEIYEVTYETTLNLNKDKVNTLINKTYLVADYYVSNDIIEIEQEKYQKAYDQYLLDLEKYNQYEKDLVQYDIDLKKYEDYLLAKMEYDDKKEKYDKYLLEYEQYLKELEEYNRYLNDLDQYEKDYSNFQNYLNAKKIYDEEYALYLKDYEKYSSDMEKINYQLSAMELIKTSMTSLERSIYNAVMGDTVTKVLQNKAILIEAGAPEAVVNDANDATVALKKFFAEYFSLTNNKDKYSYYQTNYRQILKNIELLLRSLDKLYRVPLVKNSLEKGGMFADYKDKFVILISQLALVSNALDRNPVKTYEGNISTSDTSVAIYFDENWRINGKSMAQALEYDYDFVESDENAGYLPLGYSYTMDEPIKPIEPTLVNMPSLPKEVSKPIEPTKVLDPGEEPEVVEKPIYPEEVVKPTEPTPYKVDEFVEKLINAHKNNELVYRTPFDEDVALTFTSKLSKKFINQEMIIIEFYDYYNDFIVKYETECGSYIVFDEKLPTKPSDEVYSSYVFSHWEYDDGTKLDISNVTKHGKVYPVFTGDVLQKYEVTWNVDGKQEKQMYEYGSMPSYDSNILKKYEHDVYFTFAGWDKEIEKVTKNIEYTALFDKNYLISNGEKHPVITYDGNRITFDISEFDSSVIDLEKFIYEVIESNSSYEFVFINGKQQVELSFTAFETNKLKKSNLKFVEIVDKNISKYEYEYAVNLLDANGQCIQLDCSLNILCSGEYDKNKSTLYAIDENNNLIETRATITSSKLNAKIEVNKVYCLYPKYSIITYQNEYVGVNVEKSEYQSGEVVTFETFVKQNGIEVSTIHITSSNGVIEFTNNSFVMPYADVNIIVEYKYISYTVTFVSDGKEISSKNYKYGDTVFVPATPYKEKDENYTYTFVSWDKEIAEVTEDVVYTAVFEKHEIIVDDPIDVDPSFKYLRLIKIVFYSIIGIGISLTAFFIIRKILIKK